MKLKTTIQIRLTATVAAALLVLVLPTVAQAAQAPQRPQASAPLARGAGYGLAHGSKPVRTLQLRLRALGDDPGPIDGFFGPLTESAVVRFQARKGLVPDGLVGHKTRAALVRAARVLAPGVGYSLPYGSAQVRRLQRSLRAAGAHPGPIDGRFGPMTEAAVIRFQQRHGLAADGVAGEATTAALTRQTEQPTRRTGGRHSAVTHSRQPARATPQRTPPVTAAARSHGADGSDSLLSATSILALAIGLVLGAGLMFFGGVPRRGRGLRRLPSPMPGWQERARSDAPRHETSALAERHADDRQAAPALPEGQAEDRRGTSALHRDQREAVVLPAMQGEPRERSVPAEAKAERWRAQGAASGPPVLGYASIPREAAGEYRTELRTQLQAIVTECRRRGLVLVDVVREHEPERAKSLQRPGLGYALRRIANGEACGLVVADLSRISRSVTDVGEVLDWFARAGARLVAARPRLDTGEEDGKLAARTLINVSSSERERLGERTRKGLEAAQRERRRRGRSAVADNPGLSDRIARMRAEGMTLQAIADRLNEEGVPTIRGGVKWRPSSVQAAVGYRRPQQRDGAAREAESGGEEA